MKTIYKYPIDLLLLVKNKVRVELPHDATVLSVINQKEIPVLYALVDTDYLTNDWETETFTVYVYGTGQAIPEEDPINDPYKAYKEEFLGTLSFDNGNLILHFFVQCPGPIPV